MKLFLIILSTLMYVNSYAADPAFVVYYSKGNISKAGSKSVLKKGDHLQAKDQVVIGEGARLVLVCSNYQVIQLSKKGTYSVKNLTGQCNSKTAYSGAYFKYVWNELTHPHKKPEKDPEAFMKNVGAVSRGCNEVALGMPFDTLQYFAGSLPIQWWAAYSKPAVALFDQPLDGAPIKTMPLVTGQPLQLSLLTRDLQPGIYYWQILGEDGGNCERKYLQVWSKLTYTKTVQSLLQNVPVTSPAETAYASGFVMHENNFMAEALRYYNQAAKLNPKNTVYKNALKKFYETNF